MLERQFIDIRVSHPLHKTAGARVALFGRNINTVERTLTPETTVVAYHGDLAAND